MRMTRYEPLNVFNQFHNELNRMLSGDYDDQSSAATSDWVPAVDIDEYPDRFVLYVDVPGVDPAAIDITLDNGVLTIRGERSVAANEENGGSHRRVERVRGGFHRRFTLPDTADADNVKASSNNGVLEVSIPKQPEVQPRRITVNG